MENLNIARIEGRIWINKPYACPYDSEMFKMATSITEERNEFTLDDLALLMENYLSLYIYAENAVIILRNENYNRVTLDVCMFLENAEYQCTRTIYNRRGKNVKNICSFISEIIKCKSFQECMDTQYKAEAQGIIPAKRRKKMNRTDNTTDNTNHSQKSIVDCVYEIDDLGEFLRTHRVVCPLYYISGSICNEIPKESEKYKEIKKYIDSKLDMKRGCTYSAIIKIVWAAIYNAYSSMHWDELSLKFKEPLKRATIILNIDDSIKENIECFKKQAIAYFDAHDDSIPVSQRKFTINYIWNNIDECESLDEIKTLAGSFFTVQYVAQDIIPAKKKK